MHLLYSGVRSFIGAGPGKDNMHIIMLVLAWYCFWSSDLHTGIEQQTDELSGTMLVVGALIVRAIKGVKVER